VTTASVTGSPRNASASVLIFAKTLEGYNLATSDPSNFDFIKHVDQATDGRIAVFYATPLGMLEAFKAYKNNIFNAFYGAISRFTYRTACGIGCDAAVGSA
jgi:hypothetical protein